MVELAASRVPQAPEARPGLGEVKISAKEQGGAQQSTKP